METAKKSRKKAEKISARFICDAFRSWILTEGKKPVSVFKFCASIQIPEATFYGYFGSFEAVEKSIWHGYAVDVIARLQEDSAYGSFSAREKILSFYFTLADVLKADRSFVLLQLGAWRTPALLPPFLKFFKKEFDTWIDGVMEEGKGSGEISQRPWIDTRYGRLFWMHLLFILQFWRNDDSPGFESTDAAIEKSVNLAFDLIGKGVLDNALDFGKFLYQTSKN